MKTTEIQSNLSQPISANVRGKQEMSYLIHKCENHMCKVQKVAIVETVLMDEMDLPRLPMREANVTSGDSMYVLEDKNPLRDNTTFSEIFECVLERNAIPPEYFQIYVVGMSILLPALILVIHRLCKHNRTLAEIADTSCLLTENSNAMVEVLHEVQHVQDGLQKSMIDLSSGYYSEFSILSNKFDDLRNEILDKERVTEDRLRVERTYYTDQCVKSHTKFNNLVLQLSKEINKEKEQTKVMHSNMKILNTKLDSTYSLVDLVERFINHTALYLDYQNLSDLPNSIDAKMKAREFKSTYNKLATSYHSLCLKLFSKRTDSLQIPQNITRGPIGDGVYPTRSLSPSRIPSQGIFSGGKWYRMEGSSMVQLFPEKSKTASESANNNESPNYKNGLKRVVPKDGVVPVFQHHSLPETVSHSVDPISPS